MVHGRTTSKLLLLALVLQIAAGCSADMRPGAKSIFEAFSPPPPAEAAEMALDRDDPDRRFRGIQLLANAYFGGGDTYLELYIDSLEDPDSGVRWASVSAIGRHGTPDLVPQILPLLQDQDPLVRLATARALQRLHNPIAIEPLIRSLRVENEIDPRVRTQAAEALGQYATTRVVQELIATLDDTSLAVNQAAISSLEILTGQNFGIEARAWVAWVNTQGRDLFAARQPYVYPTFERGRNLIEYLPFMPPPPNENSTTPVGLPPTVGR